MEEDTWRGGGVSPEDEDRGYERGEGVRGGEGLEERDAGLREAVDEDRDLVAAEGLWVRLFCGVAAVGRVG